MSALACALFLLPVHLRAQDSSAATLPPGVRAVWDSAKAFHETTPTRERICINGLWRWQPAQDAGADLPSTGWGFYKVPACWPGIEDYLQSDYQTLYRNPGWKNTDLREVHSAWYQRTVTIPQNWAGRRICLEVEYLNSYTEVYIDGKKAGQLRFPGGEIDITAAVRPGATHVLTMLVVAMPLRDVMETYNDTNTGKRRKGSVERRGLCGDLWLVGEPAQARFSDVKIDTSFRKSEVTFEAGLEGLSPDAHYKLRARISDEGRKVAEFTSPVFGAGELKEGRHSFTAPWKPKKLWDINTPQNQYDAEVSLLDEKGKAVDVAVPVRFGFRELWIQGRDFYLNGTRIYLSLLTLDNAQVGAGLSTYAAAKESFLRLKSFGINALYTHNYSCEPGVHLSFSEILRAADDVGMLVSLSQPHFSAYDWKTPDADKTNGYAGHAAFYVHVAGSHPSVVFYSTSHNATGYGDDTNPTMIDGIADPRGTGWAANNARQAVRAEAIIHHLDPSRIVYHHSSGNLTAIYTLNFYLNFVPIQELDDWFEHWATVGVKPLVLVEYGVPFGWDWAMYRGWYNGGREFGSAVIPWEYCIAEWDAQFLGDSAYQISELEKRNLRWEAQQFRQGRAWHRWDYPGDVGDVRFGEIQPVQAAYTTDNWRAFRTWGLSANSPWEFERFWKARDGYQAHRQNLPVDWDNIQKPGYSVDFIDHTYHRFDLADERSDWVATPTAQSLIRNNMPLLGWIAGEAEHFTVKDHVFQPGQTIEKQLIVINNSRLSMTCNASWSLNLATPVKGAKKVVLETGNQARVPVQIKLPSDLAPGNYEISANFKFSNGESHEDTFAIQVIPAPAPVRAVSKIALFDPTGQTAKLLASLGIPCQQVEAGSDLSGFDVLVIGKSALTVDGAAPVLKRVRDGLKVIVFEQTADVLEKRLGFKVEEYGLRQVWPRVPDSPLLAGLKAEDLHDWHGSSTLLPGYSDNKISRRFDDVPVTTWCGLEVPHLWRNGNWGNVASVLIEKPQRGDFLPIADGGYALQYSPLLEYREGRGMVLFCQMDVTGRTESDPAAETLAANIFRYVDGWQPAPRRTAVYAGEPAGLSWLSACGVDAAPFKGQALAPDQVLVVGPGGDRDLAGQAQDVSAWIKGGGRVAALGLDEAEANSFLPAKVTMRSAEHIAAYFSPFSGKSLLAGIGSADVHNRDPRKLPLVTGGATPYGDGVLAATDHVAFFQLPPFEVSRSMGALGSVEVVEDNGADHRKCVAISLGSMVYVQFGQKAPGGEVGKTYTIAASVKAVDGPAIVRFEVERAGGPYDRAVIGDNITVNPGEWTELHLTFPLKRAFPQGLQAYVSGSGDGAKFKISQMRFYEGDYVAPGDSAANHNLFKNVDFKSGLNSWYVSRSPEKFNLRRTFCRTSFALSRLLGNFGVSGSTPLLERFSDPVGIVTGPSVVKNGTFHGSEDAGAKGNVVAENWDLSGPKGCCTREALGDPQKGYALAINVPAVAAGTKAPQVMLAQYDVAIEGGHWYRMSARTRAEDLKTDENVSWSVANTLNWRQGVFESDSFRPRSEWRTETSIVKAQNSVAKGSKLQIWFNGTGKLWLADVRLEPVSDPTAGRWLDGLYLTRPTDWDDPYRFFGW